jgi:hypothetical protein
MSRTLSEIEADIKSAVDAREARARIGGTGGESRAIFIENCNRRIDDLVRERDALSATSPARSYRRLVYVSHCLSAATKAEMDENRRDASAWCAWLAENYHVSPLADWIVLSSQWTDENVSRKLGLECDEAVIATVGLVILTGPSMSSGMKLEAGWARETVDLLGLDLLYGRPTIDERLRAAGIIPAQT